MQTRGSELQLLASRREGREEETNGDSLVDDHRRDFGAVTLAEGEGRDVTALR